jgi:hypothetical protein
MAFSQKNGRAAAGPRTLRQPVSFFFISINRGFDKR